MPNRTDDSTAFNRVHESKEHLQRYGNAWHWFVQHVLKPVPWLKILRFCVAVLASGVLWYLLKLSREYSVDISYPLVVTSPPAGYMLSGPSETKVSMRVRGNGYTLMRYRTSSSRSPLEVNLQELGISPSSDSVAQQCISRAELERILAPQIPTELTLEHFATEQLCYNLSRMDQRKLPVVPSIRYSLRPQFAQFQPLHLSQDSVTVVGPAAELAQMKYAYTDTLELGEVSESQQLKLTLSKRGEVQFIPPTLTCNIAVSQFTQKRFVVPIQVESSELHGHVTLLPGAVELTCTLPLETYARIKADDFTLRVRFYSEITPERLLVELVDVPHEARNVTFSPQYVSYLIEK